MDENPKAFKHWIGSALLVRLATQLRRVEPRLPVHLLPALEPRLLPLELKDRVRLVRDALHQILPASYPRALTILMKVARAKALKGFDLWPITEFVQLYGLGHFDRSMAALHVLTQRFTAEFALRPFLRTDPARTFETLRRWAHDPNPHVRRAASEGSRPRLPWGEKVHALIEDPGPGLAVLEILRFETEIYVRRSVANHLNDVAKDHPDLVVGTLGRWRRECPPTAAANLEWIVRHALRTLIKKGHPGALALVGVHHEAAVAARGLSLASARVRVGGALDFAFTLASTAATPQKLVVDYVIHFRTANGGESTKVFKLRTFALGARARIRLSKRHSLKPITTRVYHAGSHRLTIQVNGRPMLTTRWQLLA
jgi:3-methyladenine DNA glycosylase AlkC